MSELALQRIREAKELRLTRLDLGNCGLTELPKKTRPQLRYFRRRFDDTTAFRRSLW